MFNTRKLLTLLYVLNLFGFSLIIIIIIIIIIVDKFLCEVPALRLRGLITMSFSSGTLPQSWVSDSVALDSTLRLIPQHTLTLSLSLSSFCCLIYLHNLYLGHLRQSAKITTLQHSV